MTQFKPSAKLFDLSEVKRCPVTLSEEAKIYINASHYQGRMLPQALSEHFGKIEQVESISIDLAPMQSLVPSHEDTEASVLLIVIRHMYNSDKDMQFLLNSRDLRDTHQKTLQPTIQARTIVKTLMRNYPHK